MLEMLRTPVRFARWGGHAGSGSGGGIAKLGTAAAAAGGGPEGDAARLFAFDCTHTVLLMGEGDLAFTDALLARAQQSLGARGGPRIVSSVLLSREQLLEAHPGCKQRLARLESAAADGLLADSGGSGSGAPRLRLLFRLCATQLHRLGGHDCPAAPSTAPGGGRGSSKGSSKGTGFCLADATHIVLNFPHVS